jgi:hypothetical protein
LARDRRYSPRPSVSDSLAAVNEAFAHEQAKLAGAVAVHSTIGYGGDIRDDIQLLGDVKRG